MTVLSSSILLPFMAEVTFAIPTIPKSLAAIAVALALATNRSRLEALKKVFSK